MAIAELTDTLQNTMLDDGPLVFSPHTHSRWSNLNVQPIPRFLFRVYTPRSDGFMDTTVACSRDYASKKFGSNDDIFATQTPQRTATLITDHFRWTRNERSDNLVSWSSSMLFLIRYIFYRHYDSEDRSSLDDIYLLVIDTDKFPACTFIRDLDLISAFVQFDNSKAGRLKSLHNLRATTEHYFGEYLSQGCLRINGRCSTVSAQAMIDRGLLDLHAVFRSAWEGEDSEKWVTPVHTARETIRTAPNNGPAPLDLLNKVCAIVSEYGQAWRLPIAVHLLALLPYSLEMRQVYDRLRTHLRSTRLEFDRCATYWRTIHAPGSMPELTRGQSIMKGLSVTYIQGG